MKKIKLLVLFITVMLLLSSCESVYQLPKEPAGSVDSIQVDINQEYYTTGEAYRQGNNQDGYLYEGCWIYIEEQPSIGKKGEKSDGTPIYGTKRVKRIVKYNPVTGVVSSPCLDPVCNHSLESGCPMLGPETQRTTFRIGGIFGDWMIISIKISDDMYSAFNEERVYNLKTGEYRQIYEEDTDSMVMVRWNGGSYFEGKYYKVKNVLDYSKTSFNPNVDQHSVLDYSPETICILCEYDFETDTTIELFELPAGFGLSEVTSKRFFFRDDANDWYSCNRDGSNMKKEEARYSQSSNRIGTYAYEYCDTGFFVYDLLTNQTKEFKANFTLHSGCFVSDSGMVFDYHSKTDEINEFVANRSEFFKEHADLGNDAINELYSLTANRIVYSGTAQIRMTDFKGENMRVVFEKENAFIDTVYVKGKYAFANVTFGDPVNDIYLKADNQSRCCINLETGEITEIPFLDIVVPDEYLK